MTCQRLGPMFRPLEPFASSASMRERWNIAVSRLAPDKFAKTRSFRRLTANLRGSARRPLLPVAVVLVEECLAAAAVAGSTGWRSANGKREGAKCFFLSSTSVVAAAAAGVFFSGCPSRLSATRRSRADVDVVA